MSLEARRCLAGKDDCICIISLLRDVSHQENGRYSLTVANVNPGSETGKLLSRAKPLEASDTGCRGMADPGFRNKPVLTK